MEFADVQILSSDFGFVVRINGKEIPAIRKVSFNADVESFPEITLSFLANVRVDADNILVRREDD